MESKYFKRKKSKYFKPIYYKKSYYIKNAKNKKRKMLLTENEIYLLFKNKCYYCGIYPNPLNGIDRIDNKNDYEIDNVVSCCSTCNYMKGTLSLNNFICQIIKIYNYNK